AATATLGGQAGQPPGYDPYAGYDDYGGYEQPEAPEGRRGSRVVGMVLAFLAIALLAGGTAYAIVHSLQSKDTGGQPQPVTIPDDLVGKQRQAAQAELEALGFQVSPQSEESSKEKDTVIATD